MDELYLNNRTEGLGVEAKRRSIVWSYVLSAGFYDAYYKKATQIRTLIIEDFKKVFEEVDILLTPASPSVAWKKGEKSEDPVKMYLADAYTIPASLAGLPGISVPAWFAHSEDEEKELLPVGIQLLAPRLDETTLFEVSHIYEKATQFGKQNPIGFED
jgi:aspartyl-tRNA(Asn)/glutamyl-tRNA(Gln) amidotransferase subunit A